MKKITILPSILFLLLFQISCTKNESETSTSKSNLQAQFNQLCVTSNSEKGEVSDMTKPFLTKIETQKCTLLDKINPEINLMVPMSPHWHGPNYVTGTLTKAVSNVRILINSSQEPRLATGYYYCDVYADNVVVTLPVNSVGRLDLNDMPKYGYSNYSTLQRGVNYTQATGPSGNVFSMTTYSIVVNYDAIGNYIGLVSPYDLTNIQFAYSYFK